MGRFKRDDTDEITGIIAEFSEVFAFSRTRWARYAEEVDPELSGVGILILQSILRTGPVTATGICRTLDMDKSFVSRQLAKLRQLGFIETTESPEDRRVQLITGNDKAQRVVDRIRKLWASAYRERFEGWSDSELAALREGLHRFNAANSTPQTEGPAVRCARHAKDSEHTHEGEASKAENER